MQCNHLPHRILAMGLLIASAILALGRPALCDKREYIINYGYWTAYPGENEMELYSDFNQDSTTGNSKRFQVEWEHGWTSRLMTGLYWVFESDTRRPMRLTMNKLNAKYRLGDPGKWIVDPALYVEYKKKYDAGAFDAMEYKLILSKDFGTLNVTTNLVWEHDLAPNRVGSFKYSAGITQPLTPNFAPFLEFQRNDRTNEAYLLPGGRFTESSSWQLLVGPQFGLTPRSTDFALRSILIYEF